MTRRPCGSFVSMVQQYVPDTKIHVVCGGFQTQYTEVVNRVDNTKAFWREKIMMRSAGNLTSNGNLTEVPYRN